jgi:anti-anti-sigma factor
MTDVARLTVSSIASPSSVALVVVGELDIETAPTLREAVFEVMLARGGAPQIRRVVLDFAQVQFCDAAGLRPVLEARTALAERGVVLSLRRPQPLVRRVLDLLDLAGVLHVEE